MVTTRLFSIHLLRDGYELYALVALAGLHVFCQLFYAQVGDAELIKRAAFAPIICVVNDARQADDGINPAHGNAIALT